MAPRLIVAIDYGTTFTSAGYVLVQSPSSRRSLTNAQADSLVTINKDWCPGDSDYTPSQIAYPKADLAKDAEQLVWGYGVEYLHSRERQTFEIVSCAKATIHGCSENCQLLQLSTSSDQATHSQTHKPIVDFLRSVHRHIVKDPDSVLRKCYPHEMEDPTMTIEYVIGVPSAWDMHEQLVFMDLVAEAGMPGALRAPEPEAMAASFFSRNPSIKVGTLSGDKPSSSQFL